MAAQNTDLLKKLSRRWVGQIGAGGVTDGVVTTIPLSSSTNLPTDTAVVATIGRVDANGTATPTLEEAIIGVVSGNNLVNCVRGVEGTAQAHLAGAAVEILVSTRLWNDVIDALLVGHTQLGAHIASLPLTTPKITTHIGDANGNEIFKLIATANAVNEWTVADAASGTSPTMTMSGGDTNVGFDLKMKASGRFRKPTVVGIQVIDSGTDTAVGDGKAFFRVPAELNGMNLTGVNASVYTAGTTNTTDVQLRNKTDSVDMLSTKITIDSGETDTSTAATPAVINTATDDVATGDVIAVDVDAVSTTAAKGLYIELRFELPA